MVSAIVKLSLKSIQELVQLQTLNRSGYQQIQLDMEFLKNPLKEIVHDEAVIDFLLKEVINNDHFVAYHEFYIFVFFFILV